MAVVEDDASVPDDAVVWRRVHWNNTTPDEANPGRLRLSSGGFEDDAKDKSGMSVHLPVAGETPTEYLKSVSQVGNGIAELRVGDLRAAGFGLKHRPESLDQRHFEVTPHPPSSKKGKKNALCRIARLLLEPSPKD